MKLSAQALDQLTQSMAFRQWPVERAMENAREGWEMVRQDITAQAAELLIWEAHHRIALLFDTYGPALKSANLSFSIAHDDDPYLSNSFQVNGQWAGAMIMPGRLTRNTPSSLYPELVKIDGGLLLDATCAWMDRLGSMEARQQDLSHEIQRFERAFRDRITSAAQAREGARKQAPGVEAWVRQHLLEQSLTTGTRAKVAGNLPKM